MAHPMLVRRFDRRTLLAAGTTAALLTAPGLAAPADAATALEGAPVPVADTPETLPTTEASGLQQNGAVAPPDVPVLEELHETTDPIGKVVDDVLRAAPTPIQELVKQAPGVIDDVAPVPAEPLDGVVPDQTPAPIGPAPEVGTASASPAPRQTSGPPQGPGIAPPPFAVRDRLADTTTTRRPQPFVAPVVGGRLFGDLPRRAEEFLSRAPVTLSRDALSALSGSPTTTAPSPDASSWLLATSAGMLLLLGAGHLVHARHRYTASIAR